MAQGNMCAMFAEIDWRQSGRRAQKQVKLGMASLQRSGVDSIANPIPSCPWASNNAQMRCRHRAGAHQGDLRKPAYPTSEYHAPTVWWRSDFKSE